MINIIIGWLMKNTDRWDPSPCSTIHSAGMMSNINLSVKVITVMTVWVTCCGGKDSGSDGPGRHAKGRSIGIIWHIIELADNMASCAIVMDSRGMGDGRQSGWGLYMNSFIR